MTTTATEYRVVEFIPTEWVERALWWPGLQVYSRPVRVPVDAGVNACVLKRRKTDAVEQLLRDALLPDEPFQSIDNLEDLLKAL